MDPQPQSLFLYTPGPEPISPLRRSTRADVGYSAGLIAALLAAGVMLSGCRATSNSVPDAAVQARVEAKEKAEQQAHLRDATRQELEQIPPPSKSLYLAVHSRDAWGNPFLMVGRDTVNLRVINPDANPSSFGPGGLLRPASARKQEVDIRLADLPSALGALPTNAWPYGRVIAIEEGGTDVKADRPQIRRNVETAIQTLNDLGIVVDEWTGPNGSLLR
ncbi:MAG TPA: hypothetical protein VGD59_15485 [Acidisarcina sp.]